MRQELELFVRRHTVRVFSSDDIDKDCVREILTAGILAPSGKNLQGMRFVVLHGPSPRREALAALHPRSKVSMASAPLVVAVLQDVARTYHLLKDAQSMGACMENMLLAAALLGLGGVWLGECVDRQEDVLRSLGLPVEAFVFHAVLCFGHAVKDPAATPRKPLEEYILP